MVALMDGTSGITPRPGDVNTEFLKFEGNKC